MTRKRTVTDDILTVTWENIAFIRCRFQFNASTYLGIGTNDTRVVTVSHSFTGEVKHLSGYFSLFSFFFFVLYAMQIFDVFLTGRRPETGREAIFSKNIYIYISPVKGDKMGDGVFRNICVSRLTETEVQREGGGWAEWTGERARVSGNIYIYRILYRNRCLLLRGPADAATFSAGRFEFSLLSSFFLSVPPSPALSSLLSLPLSASFSSGNAFRPFYHVIGH